MSRRVTPSLTPPGFHFRQGPAKVCHAILDRLPHMKMDPRTGAYQGHRPIKDIAVDPGLAWLGYYSVGVFGVLVGALDVFGIRTVFLSHFVFWI